MGEFDEYDDFCDLYGDVELQVSSAISSIQALSQLPVEDDRYVGRFQDVEDGVGELNADKGEENKEVGDEDPEDRNDSETEDDFDILLNDDGDYDNNNVNVNGTGYVRHNLLTGGKFGNDDDEYVNVAENKGNFGVENSGGSDGKEGFSGGSHKLQYNYMGYNSTAFPSKLKSNGSAGVASYLSTFVRDDWESDGCSFKFEKSCVGSESRRNFSLPRSRTILDVNIDTLVHKPWRSSGIDITDFFNFGFDEDSWKSYCNHLDSHRNQTGKVTGGAAYKNEHVAEVDHDYQRRPVSLTSEISCRLLESEMLKGRAIQVEDGLGERQPSIDLRLPVHRDSDVVIEIPVQDLEEGHSNSYKVPFNGMTGYFHKVSGIQEVGVHDAVDILYSSTSEDELPILEGPSQKSNSHRHTSKGDGDPPHLDSDSCKSLHVSDADEQEVQATKCDLDGLAEDIRSSDEPEKSDAKGQPTITPKKKTELSHSQQSHCSSPQSDYVGSRDGAYTDSDEFHNHPKKVSQTSASELWESSKDSTNYGVSTRSDYKYVARSRSPVQRNMKHRPRKSSLKLGLKNHLYDECTLPLSDAEDFYDGHYRAVDFHKQRKRHHDFDLYRDKDYLYREGLEHLTYQGARFSSEAGCAFPGYSHRKDNQDCRYKNPRYMGGNVERNQPFLEQRTQRLGDEVMQWKWNYRKGIYVQEMDSPPYDLSGQLITEHTPYSYNGDHTRSKRKANGFWIERRIDSDDFSAEYNYDNKFTQEKHQPMPNNWRERDYLEKRHDRELPYTRGEAKSTLMNVRRYGDPFHDCKDIWHTHSFSEDERSRYGTNCLDFHSCGEPQTAFRGQMRTTSLSRNDMIGRHGWQRRPNYVERYRGSYKLDGYTGGYINSNESIRHTYGHDSYVVERRKKWKSEVLHWSGQENDRHREDDMEAVGTPYSFGRTSSYKKFDSRPGSDHGRKLIDGREPSKIVSDRFSQFDRNSNCVHRNNLRQAPPSCWDPADSQIFVGNDKSSSRFKTGNLMYSGRYDVLDWNDDLECETINIFDKSHFRKVIQADNPKINAFHNDTSWHKKFSDTLQKNFLDFEEGQIVSDGLNNKSRKEGSAIHQSINAEELEKPRIVEILAKMEKRRERFQQPLTSKNVEEDKNSKPVADSNDEAKIQRPARKRKWGGN